MQIGSLVQLLDVWGKAHEDSLGTVTGFCSTTGCVYVHWFAGILNEPNAKFQWGRLTVVN